MSQAAASAARPLPWAPRIVPLLCFALLGGLTALRGDTAMAITATALSLLIGWLALVVFGWLLAASTKGAGLREARRAVTRGFLLLIPFTVLALVAGLGLDWDSAGAFASAGIMTSSTAVGAEMAAGGGRGPAGVVLTLLFGTALSAVWITCTSTGVPLLIQAVTEILSGMPGGGLS